MLLMPATPDSCCRRQQQTGFPLRSPNSGRARVIGSIVRLRQVPRHSGHPTGQTTSGSCRRRMAPAAAPEVLQPVAIGRRAGTLQHTEHDRLIGAQEVRPPQSRA
jgi:hypothetical protein